MMSQKKGSIFNEVFHHFNFELTVRRRRDSFCSTGDAASDWIRHWAANRHNLPRVPGLFRFASILGMASLQSSMV